jgi:hypothetical protein
MLRHVLAFLGSCNGKRDNRYHLAHYMFTVKFRVQNVDMSAAFLQMAADTDWAALHLTSWWDCGMIPPLQAAAVTSTGNGPTGKLPALWGGDAISDNTRTLSLVIIVYVKYLNRFIFFQVFLLFHVCNKA